MYRVPSSVQNVTSHFRTQNTASRSSMVPGSYYQTGAPAESTWSYEYDNRWEVPTPQMGSPGVPWQWSSPARQNTNTQYQNPVSLRGQTAQSGLEFNAAPAAQNLSYATKDDRSQSMYISHEPSLDSSIRPLEAERSEDDSVDDMTRDMEYSTLTTHSRKQREKGTLS